MKKQVGRGTLRRRGQLVEEGSNKQEAHQVRSEVMDGH